MAYVKNPEVDKLNMADQLKYYAANKADAGNELLRAKQVYEAKKAAGDMAGANAAHDYATQLRGATGIEDSDQVYGNNNGVDPVTQAKMTDSILNNQTAQQAPRAAGAGGTYNSNDYMNRSQQYIDSIYNNSYNSQLQKLRETRDTAMQGLNGQETQAHQNAYDQRNAADTTNLQNAQRLREMMAQNGLLSSGDNVQANVDLGTARQAALGSINRDEGNATQNIAQQRALIMNNAANNDLALMQQLQAARSGQLLGANDTDAARQLQIAQMMGYMNGDPTAAMQNQTFNQGLQTQQFAEQQKQNNIGNAMQISQLKGQLYQPKESGYELFNQTPLGPTLAGQQFQHGIQQDAIQNGFKQQQLNQSAEQFAASLGLDYNKLNLQQQQMLNDMAYRNASFGLDQQKFNYETDPNSIDNQLKQANLDKLKNPQTGAIDENKVAALIDGSPFITKPHYDSATGQTIPGGVTDKQGLSQYIASLGLPADQAKQWFMRYGLWSGK